jgi:uncharacterized protein (TIGR02246 family)
MTARDQEMITPHAKATAEAEIRALIDAQARAIRAKDLDGTAASYAHDVVLFDVVNPLRSFGSEALRGRVAQWFASFEGPIEYELRDLSIAAGADVGFSHSLNRIRGTTTDGSKLEMWWRAPVGYRKVDGAWLVTHQHASVPFDVASGQAWLHLSPQEGTDTIRRDPLPERPRGAGRRERAEARPAAADLQPKQETRPCAS